MSTTALHSESSPRLHTSEAEGIYTRTNGIAVPVQYTTVSGTLKKRSYGAPLASSTAADGRSAHHSGEGGVGTQLRLQRGGVAGDVDAGARHIDVLRSDACVETSRQHRTSQDTCGRRTYFHQG